jgi:hypothetical protein
LSSARLEAAMSVAAKVFEWRCQRALRLLEMRRRRALEADLAVYASPSDRSDLLALLDCYDDDQTAEVREILGQQQLRSERERRRPDGFAFGS